MDGVRAVTVRGLPDAASEHEVEATITGAVTEAEVRAWAEQRLAAYKRPTRLRIVAG